MASETQPDQGIESVAPTFEQHTIVTSKLLVQGDTRPDIELAAIKLVTFGLATVVESPQGARPDRSSSAMPRRSLGRAGYRWDPWGQ